jgi:hypothetical protein
LDITVGQTPKTGNVLDLLVKVRATRRKDAVAEPELEVGDPDPS